MQAAKVAPWSVALQSNRAGLRLWAAQGIVAHTVRAIWPAYLVASILILVGITWALPEHHYVDFSFQPDEYVATNVVDQLTFPRLSPAWLAWGTALFYQDYLVKSVVSLGGFRPLDEAGSLLVGRSVVVASALTTVTLVYLLGRNVFDEATGRLAALILAVLPGFVINSHYFKTDVPMTCWAVATMFAGYWLIGNPRHRAAVAVLGLLVGYTASVKYSGAVLFPAGLIALVLASRANQLSIPWKSYALWTLVGFAAGAPYALLKPAAVLDGLRFVAGINSQGVPYIVARPPALIDYFVNVLPYSMSLPMTLAAAVAVALALVQGGVRLLPIWVFIAAYCVLLASDNARLVRYTVPLLPLLALFVAHALVSAVRRRYLRLPTIALGSLLAGYAFVFSLSYVQAMARPDPRIQADQWIEQHVARGTLVPATYNHFLNIPRLSLIGYEPLNVGYDIGKLESAESPYFILSDHPTRFYLESLDKYPEQKHFLEYVGQHYRPVAEFQNSQTLLGIDSLAGPHIPQDWLIPNPRITIFERIDEAAAVGP